MVSVIRMTNFLSLLRYAHIKEKESATSLSKGATFLPRRSTADSKEEFLFSEFWSSSFHA